MKTAVCIIAYLPLFLVILDTVITTQLNHRFSQVPILIREVTALRWDRLNQLNSAVSN